jgi:hypothetical protein
MTSPAPGDRFTRGFLAGRPRVFIDGRPSLPSSQSMKVSQVEIAAIDPDFTEETASIPYGIR